MKYLHEIIVNLSVLRFVISANAEAGCYDINRSCENLYRDIFNVVFKRQYENMNGETANYPAIDLGDKRARIAVQITSEKGRRKIQHTLDEFESHSLWKDYDKLYIFNILSKSDHKSPFYFDGKIAQKLFDHTKYLKDSDDLLKVLKNADADTLEKVYEIVRKGIGYCIPPSSPMLDFAKEFPEFGERMFKNLKKLEEYGDLTQNCTDLYNRLSKISPRQRFIVYTFLTKCDGELNMDGGTFDGFCRVYDMTRADVRPLFEGKYWFFDSNEDSREGLDEISIYGEDTWRVIKEKISEEFLRQLVINCDFSLLDT